MDRISGHRFNSVVVFVCLFSVTETEIYVFAKKLEVFVFTVIITICCPFKKRTASHKYFRGYIIINSDDMSRRIQLNEMLIFRTEVLI